jgi:phosphoglycolate phosphatase
MTTFLFDLDGTLTDPREGITRSIAYALERMGRARRPLDDLTFAIGPPLRRSLAQAARQRRRREVERTARLYRERFADVGLFENAPYEGIVESLATLRSGHATLLSRPPSRACTPSASCGTSGSTVISTRCTAASSTAPARTSATCSRTSSATTGSRARRA